MADAGSFNADLGVNLQFNVDGAGLVEMSKTIKEISKGKDLQRYWQDVETATNNASKAIERYNKNVNSQDLAESFLKQINALKAITQKENLSELFPNMDINFDELIDSAKKIAPKINSEFSVSNFKQAFNTFDLLKDKGIELSEVFSRLADYAGVIRRNTELSSENSEFRNLLGDTDVEKLKKDLGEIRRLRQQAETEFESFLNVNKIEKTDYWGDEKFSEYFAEIRNGSMTATDAITRFKTEYAYLLEESFKSNNNTFGLEQLQSFANKLDIIFRQVEETSNKINDIISNGVITKSVKNLSVDNSLSNSQRSLFGNLLQDEETLKEITSLFKKLIKESNTTKNTTLFDEEQFNRLLILFEKIESSLSSMKAVFVDVGDGEEFSPLLKMINDTQSSIEKLNTSVKGIGLNMNIDFGSDAEMESKVQSKIANALQAYQRLFEHIKMSSAGGSMINTNFFEFDINQYDTMMGKLQAYRKFIENMRKEAKEQYNGKDVLFQNTDKSYWSSVSAAMGQVTKAFNKMNASADTNLIEKLFSGKTDLTEVITQLNLIADKLGEISNIASEFKNTFVNGFNVSASVEEIDKLTSRVKELEDELSKIKVSSINPVESNISSPIKDVIQSDVKASADSSVPAIKDESKAIEQVAESAEKASNAKNKFAESNKKVKQSADASVDAVKEEKISLASMQKEIDNFNKKSADFKIKPDDQHSFTSWTNQIKELDSKIAEYQSRLNDIKIKGGIVDKDDEAEISKIKKEIQDLIATMSKTSTGERGFTDISLSKAAEKVWSILQKNAKFSKEARAAIRAYYDELASGNPSRPVNEILVEVNKLVQAERAAGREGKRFLDVFKNKTFYNFANRLATYYLSMYDFIRYARNGINAIRELDTALIDLKKTTTMNTSQLEDFYFDSNDVAKQMGVTTKEIIEQASAWSRLGYSSKEASTQMAELSSQFASISPGMEIDQAQEGLVSIMKAWGLSEDEVKSEIMDPINTLGNKFAESNADIVEGMKRSAAALSAVGTDYKDAFALFTGGQEVLQNAEVMGRALRSISMRVRGFDENSEDGVSEKNEELKNITGELIDLTKTAEHAQGVSIFKEGSTTEFKSLVEYFGEIHDIWDEMSEKQQNDFLNKAFAKTQAQAGAAIIQNFDAVRDSIKEMEDAAGSSDREMEIIRQSIDYKINALKETWVGNAQAMLDRDDLGKIIDGLTKLSEAIGFVVEKAGLLGTIGLGAGLFAGIKNVGVA